MVDNTKKNAQDTQRLLKVQEATAKRIYKEIVNDSKLLSNFIKKKDFDKVCTLSKRIYNNSEILK